MRTIKQSSAFKSDLKREAKGLHRVALAKGVVDMSRRWLRTSHWPRKHRDHALTGDWKDRDCHVTPDLVLIYRKPDDTVLQLARLGSHSELGL